MKSNDFQTSIINPFRQFHWYKTDQRQIKYALPRIHAASCVYGLLPPIRHHNDRDESLFGDERLFFSHSFLWSDIKEIKSQYPTERRERRQAERNFW